MEWFYIKMKKKTYQRMAKITGKRVSTVGYILKKQNERKSHTKKNIFIKLSEVML